jgi:hypothetical protein
MWASFTYSLARTPNSYESFHLKINAMFHSARSNIYQIIKMMLNVQCVRFIKLRSDHIIYTRNYIKEIEKEIGD